MLLWLGKEEHSSQFRSNVLEREATTVAEIVSSCILGDFHRFLGGQGAK